MASDDGSVDAVRSLPPPDYRRSWFDRLLDRVALTAAVSATCSVALTVALSYLFSGRAPGSVGVAIAVVAGSSIAVAMGSQRNRSLARLAEAHAEIHDQMVELERLRAELEVAAACDPLTGLLNRRGLDVAFEREWTRCERSGQPLTVVVIDVDAFKLVNDVHGHQAGDRAIASIADALRDAVRSTDPIARFGGDEFVVVLPEHDERAASEVVERVRVAVAQSPAVARLGIAAMSVSVGAARAPDDGRDLDALLHVADGAMYASKREASRAALAGVDDAADPAARSTSGGGVVPSS